MLPALAVISIRRFAASQHEPEFHGPQGHPPLAEQKPTSPAGPFFEGMRDILIGLLERSIVAGAPCEVGIIAGRVA